jgi:lantibiotic modifying enzyme
MTLAEGHAGIAVTLAQFARVFPDESWDKAARQQLELAVAALQQERRAQAGLFSGLAGIAFAAMTLDPMRYARLLSTLDHLLTRRISERLRRLGESGSGCAVSDFDTVSGLAGIGAYLVTRGQDTTHAALDGLVELLTGDRKLPRWHTPHHLLASHERGLYPKGYLNCGLAHGVAGPLALLSIAAREGARIPRQAAAIEIAAGWLVDHAVEDDAGINWPAAVPLPDDARASAPTRPAWCYGAAGVARALWLAGHALGQTELQRQAVEALASVYRRPGASLGVEAPTFCHGQAGLLHITLRMAADSSSDELTLAAGSLAGRLVGSFEPESSFGYRNIEPGGNRTEQPGMLEGAAGVALVLLAAATPLPPTWDRMFLLS